LPLEKLNVLKAVVQENPLMTLMDSYP